MPDLNLDELEAVAKAATSGPWCPHPNGTSVWEGPDWDTVNNSTQPAFRHLFNATTYDEIGLNNVDFVRVFNPAVALSLISELRSLRAAGEWVATNDRLPDSDVWVLVANDQPDHLLAQLEFTDDSEGHSEPYWAAAGGDLALCNYPFWMPLPSPPVVKP